MEAATLVGAFEVWALVVTAGAVLVSAAVLSADADVAASSETCTPSHRHASHNGRPDDISKMHPIQSTPLTTRRSVATTVGTAACNARQCNRRQRDAARDVVFYVMKATLQAVLDAAARSSPDSRTTRNDC